MTTEAPGADDAGDHEDEAAREGSFARRSLLRAGWVIPAVVALDATPAFAAAAGSTAPHTDIPGVPHTDTVVGHIDVAAVDTDIPHVDVPGAHFDAIQDIHVDLDPGTGHVDFFTHPHADGTGPHTDMAPQHVDTPHDDTAPVHTDTPAQPHVDA